MYKFFSIPFTFPLTNPKIFVNLFCVSIAQIKSECDDNDSNYLSHHVSQPPKISNK